MKQTKPEKTDLLDKLLNELSRDSLHVHEMYNNFIVDYSGNMTLHKMPLIGVCHDIRHKYDADDCALVFYDSESGDNHWIHVPGVLYKNLIEIEELKMLD